MLSLLTIATSAQQDSAKIGEQLMEVIVVSERSLLQAERKPLSTLDHFLERSGIANMIRRGAYAWEPFLNGMSSERSVITIDGMRIYAACTDKMDPVTSYLETSNLSNASIHSGTSGASTGATISGSLDLQRRKIAFGDTVNGSIFTGYESANGQKIVGGTATYSKPKFYSGLDMTYRDADNYRAGGGQEIPFSQFTKFNLSSVNALRLGDHGELTASVIYDKATNVGYPALPMDVSLAEAFIGSISYTRRHISKFIDEWQTKIYYNDITHVMDDSKRPNVPVRMDMPGWSNTAGFYSLLAGSKADHDWKVNLNGHYNRSLAEMTMFSNTPGEKNMYMLTWPGIRTRYLDLYAEDSWKASKQIRLVASGGISLHTNVVGSDFGYESLKIFYSGMPRARTRLLKRFSLALYSDKKNWHYSIGIGYGQRAPSVSEGYGFYLFNSFDRFDYIGNPEMGNESSLSVTASVSYTASVWSAKLSGSAFDIRDYIIGLPQAGLSVMTIGAAGVKVYGQLPGARIYNMVADLSWQPLRKLNWTGRASYRRGIGTDLGNLPLMQPLSAFSSLSYTGNKFSTELSITAAARQLYYSPLSGESPLPGYATVNCAVSDKFLIGKRSLVVKAGIDNILDRRYTTFADWNRIYRMGRNIFVNLVMAF